MRKLVSAGTGVTAGFVAWWELQRHQLRLKYEDVKRRYRETGAESRFPFYGRDTGYEVDYFIELGLNQGDVCHATYNLRALPLQHAAAAALSRWLHELGTNPTNGSSFETHAYDEEAFVEIVDGQRKCRHPPRPVWWSPWWPGGSKSQISPYSEWLAWQAIQEVHVLSHAHKGRQATGFTVR